MTIKYENVYINETSTVTGPYEKKGPYMDILIRVMMTFILVCQHGNKQREN